MCCRDNLKAVRGEREGEKDGWKKQWLWLLGLWLLIWPWAEPPIVRQISRVREEECKAKGGGSVLWADSRTRGMAGERWRRRNTDRRRVKPFRGREGKREWRGLHFTAVYWQRHSQPLVNKSLHSERWERCLHLWNSSRLQSSATIITLAKCVVFGTPGPSPHCTDSLESLASHMGAQVFRLCEDEQFSLCVWDYDSREKPFSIYKPSVTPSSLLHWYRWLLSLYNSQKHPTQV